MEIRDSRVLVEGVVDGACRYDKGGGRGGARGESLRLIERQTYKEDQRSEREIHKKERVRRCSARFLFSFCGVFGLSLVRVCGSCLSPER